MVFIFDLIYAFLFGSLLLLLFFLWFFIITIELICCDKFNFFLCFFLGWLFWGFVILLLFFHERFYSWVWMNMVCFLVNCCSFSFQDTLLEFIVLALGHLFFISGEDFFQNSLLIIWDGILNKLRFHSIFVIWIRWLILLTLIL